MKQTMKRHPAPGELVNYFPGGDLSRPPLLAQVHSVSEMGSAVLLILRPGNGPGASAETHWWVHHTDSEYWDRPGIPVSQRTSRGVWDFHPVYGPVFDRHLHAKKVNEDRRRQLEAEKDSMPVPEFEAIEALERHGSNMTAICKDTGMTVDQLKKLPKFMDALKEKKQQEWREKQGLTADSQTTEEGATVG